MAICRSIFAGNGEFAGERCVLPINHTGVHISDVKSNELTHHVYIMWSGSRSQAVCKSCGESAYTRQFYMAYKGLDPS